MSFSCRYFDQRKCLSCSYLAEGNISQAEERKIKQLKEKLAKYTSTIDPLIKNVSIYGSRNKAKMVVGGTCQQPLIGVRQASGTLHSVEQCPLHGAIINQVIELFLQLIPKYQLTPYNLETRQGEFKYLIVVAAPQSNEVMIRAVMRSKEALDRLKKCYVEVRERIPEVSVCTLNIQPKHAAIMEGEEEIILSEQKYLPLTLDGVQLFLGPKSFSQVNPEIASKLYSTASKLVVKSTPSKVLDLFCGIGAFSQYLSKAGIPGVGVELSAEAIEAAKKANALNGGLAKYFAEDAFEHMKSEQNHYQCIIVNPPRRGLGENLALKLIEASPEQIIYSSCNPETLIQDLEHLSSAYRLVGATPFDMFPLTEHLEVLVELKRL